MLALDLLISYFISILYLKGSNFKNLKWLFLVYYSLVFLLNSFYFLYNILLSKLLKFQSFTIGF